MDLFITYQFEMVTNYRIVLIMKMNINSVKLMTCQNPPKLQTAMFLVSIYGYNN